MTISCPALWRVLALLPSAVLLAPAVRADPLTPEAAAARARERMAKQLAGLDGAKMDMLFQHLQIVPGDAFRACLCPGGFHPSQGAGQGGPCMHIGPLGGISWAEYDTGALVGCAGSAPLADGSNILDQLVKAAQPQNLHAAKGPAPETSTALRKIAIDLENQCLHVDPRLYDMLDKLDRDQAAYERDVAHLRELAQQGLRTMPNTGAFRPPRDTRLEAILSAAKDSASPCEASVAIDLMTEKHLSYDRSELPLKMFKELAIPGPKDALELVAKAAQIAATKINVAGLAMTAYEAYGVWREQVASETYQAGLDEALHVIRTNRSPTMKDYDDVVESFAMERAMVLQKLADAHKALEVRLSEVTARIEANRPLPGAPDIDHYNFETTSEAWLKAAYNSFDAAAKPLEQRLATMEFAQKSLAQYMLPTVDKTCEAIVKHPPCAE